MILLKAAKALDDKEFIQRELDQKVQDLVVAGLEISALTAEVELLRDVKLKMTKINNDLTDAVKKNSRRAWLSGFGFGNLSGFTLACVILLVILL